MIRKKKYRTYVFGFVLFIYSPKREALDNLHVQSKEKIGTRIYHKK